MFIKQFYNLNKIWLFGFPVMGFQTPASHIMEGIISFHDDLFLFLVFILFFVLYVMAWCISLFAFSNKTGETYRFVHASTLEIIWTIIPAFILIMVAIPSFSLLYSIDEIIEPLLTIKVIGHQWYWSYEYLDTDLLQALYTNELNDNSLNISSGGTFDSYLFGEEHSIHGETLRLLSVDQYLFIPTGINTRAIVTSADVLHSWAIPSLGVKIDACPGRLNQVAVFIKYPGYFYGQCSELCGVNHGFMPIGILSKDIWSLFFDDSFSFNFEPILSIIYSQMAE